MSELNFVKINDPRLDYNERTNTAYSIMKGGKNQNWQRFISQNFSSNYCAFVCPPPNNNVVLSFGAFTKKVWNLTLTGASAGIGQTLVQALGMATSPGVSAGVANYDAPRCDPDFNVTQNILVQVNSESFTTNPYQYNRIYQRYGRYPKDNMEFLSGSPSMPDLTQNYSDLSGRALNPLNGYGDNTTQEPRGNFGGCLITSNTALGVGDSATIQLTLYTPLCLSPFFSGTYGDDEERLGLTGVHDMNVIFNHGGRSNGLLGGIGACLWSHDVTSPSTITSITADLITAEIYFNYITPDPMTPMPPQINYPYYEPYIMQTTVGVVAPGDVVVIDSPLAQMGSTPIENYMAVTRSDATTSVNTTDCNFVIENINITYQNNPGIMANMDPYSLWKMSVSNGLSNCSYYDWKTRQGSIVCAKFGLDIPLLDDSNAPGRYGQNTYQVKVTARNISNAPIIPTLTVVNTLEGVLTSYANGTMRKKLGVLSQDDVKNAQEDPSAQAQFTRSKRVFGGNFWSDLKDVLRHIARPILNALQPIASASGPYGQAALQIADQTAKSYGLGLGSYRGGQLLSPVELLRLK